MVKAVELNDPKDAQKMVQDMAQAAFHKQHEVVWWLYRNTRAPRAMKNVLMVAANNGDIVLLEWLRAKYRTHGFDPDSETEENELCGDDEEQNSDSDSSDKNFMAANAVVHPPVAPHNGLSKFGWVGDLSGVNVAELFRGDPEELMWEAVLGGHIGVMKWLVENGNYM
ncbi:hypothetical protein PHMEG_00022228 [Phytophthora megakarya]|uniref:Uncharacterized protein n=1 Tax=Phytophthora megakarya TaxID=4795 RepID=A0A225VLL3_9STRA|nr:hypothetical protein PHMEG_00022228 [Phytophthora megakarya]